VNSMGGEKVDELETGVVGIGCLWLASVLAQVALFIGVVWLCAKIVKHVFMG